MDKFEYKVDQVNFSGLDKYEEYLNQMGDEGWELISTQISASGGLILFFKRKKNSL